MSFENDSVPLLYIDKEQRLRYRGLRGGGANASSKSTKFSVVAAVYFYSFIIFSFSEYQILKNNYNFHLSAYIFIFKDNLYRDKKLVSF